PPREAGRRRAPRGGTPRRNPDTAPVRQRRRPQSPGRGARRGTGPRERAPRPARRTLRGTRGWPPPPRRARASCRLGANGLPQTYGWVPLPGTWTKPPAPWSEADGLGGGV